MCPSGESHTGSAVWQDSTVPSSLNELIDLLDLEKLEDDLYRGRQPADSDMLRVFGGQVAAQALMASMKSVDPARHVHSLHSYFILGGDPSIPIVYDVERIRDGGSFSTRRVSARQHGEIIFYMTASFHKSEPGFEHQSKMPAVPAPADSPLLVDLFGQANPTYAERWLKEWSSMELRYVGDNRRADDPQKEMEPAVQRLWFRANGQMPADPMLNSCVLTYISDLSLLGASLLPHGVRISDPSVQPASLDHTVWFHHAVRADEWHLYDQTSPVATGARGLATARVFAEDGTLVATVAQEGLIRPITSKDDSGDVPLRANT